MAKEVNAQTEKTISPMNPSDTRKDEMTDAVELLEAKRYVPTYDGMDEVGNSGHYCHENTVWVRDEDYREALSTIRTLTAQVEREKVQRENGLLIEKRDCIKALGALAGAGICTPEETYGTNTSWAISDLCKAVRQFHEEVEGETGLRAMIQAYRQNMTDSEGKIAELESSLAQAETKGWNEDNLPVITKDMVRNLLPEEDCYFAQSIRHRFISQATESEFRTVAHAVLLAAIRTLKRTQDTTEGAGK